MYIPKVVVPKDKKKLERQIEALRAQIKLDTNEKDKYVHKYALQELERSLASI